MQGLNQVRFETSMNHKMNPHPPTYNYLHIFFAPVAAPGATRCHHMRYNQHYYYRYYHYCCCCCSYYCYYYYISYSYSYSYCLLLLLLVLLLVLLLQQLLQLLPSLLLLGAPMVIHACYYCDCDKQKHNIDSISTYPVSVAEKTSDKKQSDYT